MLRFTRETREDTIARPSTADSASAIDKAIAALESRVETMSQALFGTDEFARTANAATSVSTRLQKGMSDHMARQLSFYNMPSREDVTALGERMMAMEDRLARIEDMLGRLAGPPPKAPGPPRTKKPPAKKRKSTKKTAKKATT